MVLLTGVFAIFSGYQQTSTLLEARQQAKRLEAQRKLADQAEASRITELQNLLNSALQRLEQQSVEGRQATIARRISAEVPRSTSWRSVSTDTYRQLL